MASLSGQKSIAAAGSAEALGAGQVNTALMVKALPGNTGLAYVGHVDGDVSSSNGLPLAAGEVLVFQLVGNLQDVRVDVAVNGEGVAWLALEV